MISIVVHIVHDEEALLSLLDQEQGEGLEEYFKEDAFDPVQLIFCFCRRFGLSYINIHGVWLGRKTSSDDDSLTTMKKKRKNC